MEQGATLVLGGIDVGSSAVKAVVMRDDGRGGEAVLAKGVERMRRRDPGDVARSLWERLLGEAALRPDEVDYLATTGDGECVAFRTGHFYGMTAHARGAHFLDPDVRAALDIGGLHTRAVIFDERAKVLGYRMTSQCASGSGQFLENISRYLGVTLEEIGGLSLQADAPETCSSICAVLAETDVINMVSRGISIPNILRGIHDSMAGRYIKLLNAAKASGVVLVTGGLAADVGLVAALTSASVEAKNPLELRAHEDSVLAGAIGAALWGGFRVRKLAGKGLELRG
ncbi:MAG: benzoyl-CoA reductase subunit D [Planctomycetota bacterium]